MHVEDVGLPSRSRLSSRRHRTLRMRRYLHTSACSHKNYYKWAPPVPSFLAPDAHAQDPNDPPSSQPPRETAPHAPTTDYQTALNEVLSAQIWAARPADDPSTQAQADPESPAGKAYASKQWVEEASFVRALMHDQAERQKDVREAQRRMLAELGFRVAQTPAPPDAASTVAAKTRESERAAPALTLEELGVLANKKISTNMRVGDAKKGKWVGGGKKAKWVRDRNIERRTPSSDSPDKPLDGILATQLRSPAGEPSGSSGDDLAQQKPVSASSTPDPIPLTADVGLRPKVNGGNRSMSTMASSRSFSSSAYSLQRHATSGPRAAITSPIVPKQLRFRAPKSRARMAKVLDEEDVADFKRLYEMAVNARRSPPQASIDRKSSNEEDDPWNFLFGQLERKSHTCSAGATPELEPSSKAAFGNKESREDVRQFLELDPFELTPSPRLRRPDHETLFPREPDTLGQRKTSQPKGGTSRDAPIPPWGDDAARTERRTSDRSRTVRQPKAGDRPSVAKRHVSPCV